MTMIGDTVSHPQYGRGTITALYRNGEEWMVRFESGLRFRRPRTEFDGEQPHLTVSTISSNLPEFVPAGQSQHQARQLVESLRFGIAPAHHIENLTVGFDPERRHLSEGLNRAHRDGGAVTAVVGDYGFGKSHLVELAARAALRSNFLVATTSLDLQELPAHRSFDIYAQLMHNLRYPDSDENGLGPLLAAATERTDVRSKLTAMTFRLLIWVFGPFNFILDMLWLGADSEQQTLRDCYAGTYVVRANARPVGVGAVHLTRYFGAGLALSYPRVVRSASDVG